MPDAIPCQSNFKRFHARACVMSLIAAASRSSWQHTHTHTHARALSPFNKSAPPPPLCHPQLESVISFSQQEQRQLANQAHILSSQLEIAMNEVTAAQGAYAQVRGSPWAVGMVQGARMQLEAMLGTAWIRTGGRAACVGCIPQLLAVLSTHACVRSTATCLAPWQALHSTSHKTTELHST